MAEPTNRKPCSSMQHTLWHLNRLGVFVMIGIIVGWPAAAPGVRGGRRPWSQAEPKGLLERLRSQAPVSLRKKKNRNNCAPRRARAGVHGVVHGAGKGVGDGSEQDVRCRTWTSVSRLSLAEIQAASCDGFRLFGGQTVGGRRRAGVLHGARTRCTPSAVGRTDSLTA